MNTDYDGHYIISLTTYYPRFKYAHLAIESVLAQKCSYKYGVHLYLARADIIKNGGIIPSEIENLTEKGLKIFITEKDFLVFNKYVHVLKDHPEKTIITIDDDIIYPSYFLDMLIKKTFQFPNCIVCFRGHFLSFDRRGELLPYNLILNRRLDNYKRLLPSYCLLPTGVSGVLYPPHSLHEIAVDHSLFMSLSPHADDIWLKIASLLKGTLCVQVENRNVHFPSILKAQETTLSKINIANNENDRQLKACFSRYPALLEKVRVDDKRLSDTCKLPNTEIFFDNSLMMIKRKIFNKPRLLILLLRLKIKFQMTKSVFAVFLRKCFKNFAIRGSI
jgi:hypothetical protein